MMLDGGEYSCSAAATTEEWQSCGKYLDLDMMLDGGACSYSAAAKTGECFTGYNSISKKRKSKNERRFSDEQIRSLETMFKSETKLEPRKKLQVARELGLQPRQVAIWFQNKRARWKSKQLERDYSILRANYNTLASQFDTLKREKQALVTQLQKLNDLIQKSGEADRGSGQSVEEKIVGDQLESGDGFKSEFTVKPCMSLEGSEHGIGVLSDDDSSIKAEYFGLDEEPELLNMVEPADSSLTSPENWDSIDSEGLLDQSGSSYQWWDFWS
ncbi:Homeobox-leucine zipper protein like [Actinidia chinensis var. chinensis]|uniref:Homeobox-leucine zipper protein n=1 Tax=Actinidia chinensis var. chinensis TaxID=1590841 RepID=A0A2R6RCH7_ACTCC|nr:Homeobox-leucine zipper protein like [Actinidia chinensis var. chinensis]